jgi:hypothetical protein
MATESWGQLSSERAPGSRVVVRGSRDEGAKEKAALLLLH